MYPKKTLQIKRQVAVGALAMLLAFGTVGFGWMPVYADGVESAEPPVTPAVVASDSVPAGAAVPAMPIDLNALLQAGGVTELEETDIATTEITKTLTISDIEAAYPYTGTAIVPTPKLVLTTTNTTTNIGEDDSGGTEAGSGDGAGNAGNDNSGDGAGNAGNDNSGDGAGVTGNDNSGDSAGNSDNNDAGIDADTGSSNDNGDGGTDTTVSGNTQQTLVEGTHYEVDYTNNINAGTATVTITGIEEAGFTGTVTRTFAIDKADISQAEVSDVTDKKATGKALTQNPTLTVQLDGREVTLKAETDFDIKYANNTKAGTATVTFIGKGNFTGTATAKFTITSRTARKFKWSDINTTFKTSVQIDTTLPSNAKPAWVRATGQATSIKLNWARVKNQGAIDGLLILRKSGNGKRYVEIARVGKTTTAYTDKSAKKKNYDYVYAVVGYKKQGRAIQITPTTRWVSAVTTRSVRPNNYSAKISYNTLTIRTGEKFTLKLTQSGNPHMKNKFRWYSGNTKIATVTSKGVVTGKSKGTVVIHGLLPSGREVTCKVTVLGNKKVKKAGWFTEDGKTYYAYSNGNLARSTVITVAGKKYGIRSDGTKATGWNTIAGKKRYFSKKTGITVTNKVVDGLYIGKDGVVVTASQKAKSFAAQKGANSLYKAFQSVYKNTPYYTMVDHMGPGANWFANYGFNNRRGNCIVQASMFYYIAKNMGYDAHLVYGAVKQYYGSTPHSWVEITIKGKTYIYDLTFSQSNLGNGYRRQYGQKGTWKYMNYRRVN